ncbi:histidinol dehydrogenase [candidate division NPL-UPA2 bacterium]|nr:histidinol dehydrogenase [candidate division NPL-UPA2 bacterium]
MSKVIIKAWEEHEKMEKIVNRYPAGEEVEEVVKEVIKDVRRRGDKAVLKYTRKFDGVSLGAFQLRVSEEEIREAVEKLDKQLLKVFNSVRRNITKFHKREMRKSWISTRDGLLLGQSYLPIERVGIYVPTALVSTLLMTVTVAQVAGVKDIVVATPPGRDGSINPYLLGVVSLLGLNEVYRVGGAQAISALAFGTETIPKVQKIIGPGNKYVISAKRQLFGQVGIEMLPGPSEVVILADGRAKASFIISDLKAQAEHVEGISALLTTSMSLAKKVEREAKESYIIVTKTMEEAIHLINRIAPEHLEIMVHRPKKILRKITRAGTIFIGPYTPTAVGDYIAGPSHILPTGGTAKFSSGLGVDDFRRRSNIISYSSEQLKKVAEAVTRLAEMEGMRAHADSIRVRMGKKG